VIVRISTEGQYELPDDDTGELNELDNQAVAACESEDEQGFRDGFERLLAFVRDKGHPIADDELVGSDIILPPPDVSLNEAKSEFRGEGLIPG
jgi:hypothetical protein